MPMPIPTSDDERKRLRLAGLPAPEPSPFEPGRPQTGYGKVATCAACGRCADHLIVDTPFSDQDWGEWECQLCGATQPTGPYWCDACGSDTYNTIWSVDGSSGGVGRRYCGTCNHQIGDPEAPLYDRAEVMRALDPAEPFVRPGGQVRVLCHECQEIELHHTITGESDPGDTLVCAACGTYRHWVPGDL